MLVEELLLELVEFFILESDQFFNLDTRDSDISDKLSEHAYAEENFGERSIAQLTRVRFNGTPLLLRHK